MGFKFATNFSFFEGGYTSRSCEYVNIMCMVTVMSSVPVKSCF